MSWSLIIGFPFSFLIVTNLAGSPDNAERNFVYQKTVNQPIDVHYLKISRERCVTLFDNIRNAIHQFLLNHPSRCTLHADT